MQRILRGAIFAAEIVASVFALDVGSSLIIDPSLELKVGGIGLLFLVGSFWYYRIQVLKHRREHEGGSPSEANLDSTLNKLEHFARGTFRGRMRDTDWPGKRGN